MLGAPLEHPHGGSSTGKDADDEPCPPQIGQDETEDGEHHDAQDEGANDPPEELGINLASQLEGLDELLAGAPVLGIVGVLATLLLGLGLRLLLGGEFLGCLALGH